MLIVDKQVGLTVKNGASVLHGSRLEVRSADDIQLSKWIWNAVILVIELQNLLGVTKCRGPQRLFVGSAANTNRDIVRRAFIACEIAHRHGNEVSVHLRRL